MRTKNGNSKSETRNPKQSQRGGGKPRNTRSTRKEPIADSLAAWRLLPGDLPPRSLSFFPVFRGFPRFVPRLARVSRSLACSLGLAASLLLLTAAVPRLFAAGLSPEVQSWLAAQTKIQTWSADFVQTRALKSLLAPLKASGHVWFAAPNRFRWELGHPAQTIAVRAPRELLIIYPRLQRVERYPLTGNQTGPWRDALSLLEAGFPRSAAQMEAQYNILSQTSSDDRVELTLAPKSASARRMIPQIKIAFSTKDFSLRATELEFADGSTMRNDFSRPLLNPKLDMKMFNPSIPSDYTVVEPLKNR
jgi:outer membrane lipoprotein-sorting protein